MRYQRFTIKNYKAIKSSTIDLAEEGLVLLLGINESGKTTVLRAIESFDYTNESENEDEKNRFYKSIRNKKEINSEAKVTAEILIERSDQDRLVESAKEFLTEEGLKELSKLESISITRYFIYKNAEFDKEFYSLGTESKSLVKLSDENRENDFCRSILKLCPSIQYFEDFKDQIPEFISLTQGEQYYDPDWARTVEGMFFHADKSVPVEKFQTLTDENARKTILNKVNRALNKQFTNRWNKKLKGVKSIHKVELVHDFDKKRFTFEIVGADGVTVFAIGERSKGALWYFTFLLKTEFRKKILRAELGKTLYLIDEPGSNLHSSAQTNMVADFRTLASDSNVIYTTHSQYLIDKENLSNVYIVEGVGGNVRMKKYQEYLQGRKIDTTYYQPIIDALEIQPFSLMVDWKKVMLVEGIYDYCGFKLMFEKILKNKLDFVILPGTGASGMSTLISLHTGWGADLVVLLDNDDEGRSNQKSYKDKFPTISNKIKLLDFLDSSRNYEFENIFTEKERNDLLLVAGFTPPITKKAFQQSVANILYSPSLTVKANKIIGTETKKRFSKILDLVNKTLKN